MLSITRHKGSVSKSTHQIKLLSHVKDLEKLELDVAARNYAQSKLKAGHDTVDLNFYSHHEFLICPILNSVGDYQIQEAWRKAGASACGLCNDNEVQSAVVDPDSVEPTNVKAFLEGMLLANYQFLAHKTENVKANPLIKIAIKGDRIGSEDLEELANLAEVSYSVRNWVNEPHSHLGAMEFAREMQKLAKSSGVKAEIFTKEKIKALKMGGLLAVNSGSEQPPSFTILEYKPANAVNKKPFVFVGKGVVFDTGGLSLKPTLNSMDLMKCDMAGGAAAAGAICLVARNKLPLHVVALIPATDNRPGKEAYAPGDVISMHSGLKVEVLNTDAEGRMILADALSYAKKYKPELVVDLATLTGAAAIAVGSLAGVMMGTAADDVMDKMTTAGYNTYERVVRFPFWSEYDEMLKSSVADIKNIGGRLAGSITAGKFLEHFTAYPWIHLDIAGPAFLDKNSGYLPVGGTGYGVRLLYEFCKMRTKAGK